MHFVLDQPVKRGDLRSHTTTLTNHGMYDICM